MDDDHAPAALAGLRARAPTSTMSTRALDRRRRRANSVTFYADMRDASYTTAPPPTTAPGSRRSARSTITTIVESSTETITTGRRRRRRCRDGATRPTRATCKREPSTPIAAADAPTPVFHYFAFDRDQDRRSPTRELAPGTGALSDDAAPGGGEDRDHATARTRRQARRQRASTVFTNDVFVRTVDPNSDHEPKPHASDPRASPARRARLLDVPRDHGDARHRRCSWPPASRPPTATCRCPSRPRSARRPTPPPRPACGYYLKQLRENPDDWTQCDTASAPNAEEQSPINQQWDGDRRRDPRRWRKIPGVARRVHDRAAAHRRTTKCEQRDANKQESMIDMSHGHVQGPRHGPRDRGRRATRSIVVTFRRESFLKFVYFTDYENRDPQAGHRRARRAPRLQANCADRYRTRAHARRLRRRDPVRRPATRSTVRCTRTTRTCWSAARRSSAARRPRTARRAEDRHDRGLAAPRPGHMPTRAAAARDTPDDLHADRGKFTPNAKHAGAARRATRQAGRRRRERRPLLHRQDDHPPPAAR